MVSAANHLPRAERFVIPIAILYRSPGERDWRPGLTENISRSGVLFRAERHIEPNTLLEMLLELPTLIAPPATATALRRGRVVRAVPPTPRERLPAVAAAFLDLHGLYGTPIDPRRI